MVRVGGVSLRDASFFFFFFFFVLQKWFKPDILCNPHNVTLGSNLLKLGKEPDKGARNTEWTPTWGGGGAGIRKEERNPKRKYSIYFICRFMPNVNMLIVVKLECIHASTVERRLPRLRGWWGGCCGTLPCPHWAPARTDTSVPRTFLSTWAPF